MMNVQCKFCDQESGYMDIQLGISWYIVHIVKEHWDMVQELRHASDELIEKSTTNSKGKSCSLESRVTTISSIY